MRKFFNRFKVLLTFYGTLEIVAENIASLTNIVAGLPIDPNMREAINMIAAEILPPPKGS